MERPALLTVTAPATLQPRPILDLKQIKQIIDLMKRSELTEFAVEEEGFKLKIRRGTNGLPVVTTGRGSNPPFVPQESNSMPLFREWGSQAGKILVCPSTLLFL